MKLEVLPFDVWRLVAAWDPLIAWPEPVSPEEITKAIRAGRFRAVPNSAPESIEQGWVPGYDAERIAYLAIHGWADPICVDVGIPSLGYSNLTVEDGNHRLAAALIRGDRTIGVAYQGERDAALQWVGEER